MKKSKIAMVSYLGVFVSLTLSMCVVLTGNYSGYIVIPVFILVIAGLLMSIPFLSYVEKLEEVERNE